MEYRIGDFSLVTRLSVKTLRFYDEAGVLRPTRVDPATGYRWYDDEALDRARAVVKLRELDFGLAEIAGLLGDARGAPKDDADLAGALRAKAVDLDRKLERYAELRAEVQAILSSGAAEGPGIAGGRSATEAAPAGDRPVLAELPPLLVASIRFSARYGEVGSRFGLLFRRYGRSAAGPPLTLYHDAEYREEDADLEACLPVGEGARPCPGEGVSLRVLPAVRALELRHLGPYDRIGEAYRRAFATLSEFGMEAATPCREVYLKGPGMILRGDPRRYVTRLQVPVGG